MLIQEILEGQGGGYLEKRRMHGFEERTLALDKVYHIFFADRLPVDADALAEVYQMG